MAENPITIKGGGSLTIESALDLEPQNTSKKKYKTKDPLNKDGKITGVTIDGKPYAAKEDSTIIIHYTNPD